MNAYIKEFLDYCSYEKGYSQHTIKNYSRHLKKCNLYLYETLEDYCKEEDLAQIELKEIMGYLSEVHETKATSTKKGILCALKSFYKFLKRERYIKESPVEQLPLPKVERKLPKILSYEQIDLLVEASKKQEMGVRNEAMVEFIYATGCRAQELCNVKLSDLKDDNTVLLRGKGNKQRVVPINDQCRRAINRYLNYQRERETWADRLFVNRYGTVLSRTHVYRIFNEIGRLCGIRWLHPHAIRHTFACHMLYGGCDIRILQDLMGHESVDTLNQYLQMNLRELQKIFNAKHPRFYLR